MKRTGNWWNRVFIVLGTFLPLLALGCNSTKQTECPWAWEQDRTGTAERILFPGHVSQHVNDRRAVTNEERVAEASDGERHGK